MRRRRGLLDQTPWIAPIIALGAAVAALVALVSIASQLPLVVPTPVPPPTPARQLATPDVQPLASAALPAINYSFYDWQNTDFQSKFPQAGPMGSLAVFPWRGIHINDNQFDWRVIDSYLEAAQNMTVTLDDGRVISKPVIIEIVDNESAVPNKEIDAPYPQLTPESPIFFFMDYTPSWIRDRLRQSIAPITYVKSINPWQVGQVTNDGGSFMAVGKWGSSPCGFPVVAYAPKYTHPIWQTYYKQMVYALGQRYDRDPRVSAVVFGPGIDGEFGQPTKPYFGCDLKGMLFEQSGMTERDYLALVVRPGPLNDVADWYRDAFPTKPIYLQYTSAGKQVIDRLHEDGHNPPIGLKQATLTFDNNNQWQDDGNGTLQLMMRFSTTHPIAWENAYAYTGPGPRGMQLRYFTLLAGLMSFPTFMDFIGGWPVEPATYGTGMFDFQRKYLGRTITTTDDVWIALRDTEFWPPVGGAVRFGGWRGDFTYGLYRPDGAPASQTRLITTTELVRSPFNLTFPITTHLYSLVARRTDMASGNIYMSFAADHRWQYWGRTPAAVAADGVWYDITLKYVDLGTDTIAIEYTDYAGVTRTRSIRKRDTGQWVTSTVTLRDAYLHGLLPGGSDLRISAEPDRGGVDEIVHMLMIKAYMPGAPTPTPGLARPTRTPLPAYEQRVNTGGPEYLDSAGLRWAADQAYRPGGWGFSGGSTYSTTSAVTDVDDPALYQTERWWADRGGYRFDVPNGPYLVDLRFAETLRNRKDLRLFDVAIEGETVLQNFDIFAYAGFLSGFELSFQTVVTDGQLNIDFVARRDSAKINALRVVSYSPTPPTGPTPTPAAATPTATPLVSATPTLTPRPATPTATPTPSATPTLTLEQRITQLEERYNRLDEIVRGLIQMLSTR